MKIYRSADTETAGYNLVHKYACLFVGLGLFREEHKRKDTIHRNATPRNVNIADNEMADLDERVTHLAVMSKRGFQVCAYKMPAVEMNEEN